MLAEYSKLLDESQRQMWPQDGPFPPGAFSTLDAPTDELPLRVAELEFRELFALKLRAIAEKGVSADTVRKHLVALYKALNEHFLEKYGTFLTRDQFKRLVYEEVRVRV
jgi:hypothetical protein